MPLKKYWSFLTKYMAKTRIYEFSAKIVFCQKLFIDGPGYTGSVKKNGGGQLGPFWRNLEIEFFVFYDIWFGDCRDMGFGDWFIGGNRGFWEFGNGFWRISGLRDYGLGKWSSCKLYMSQITLKLVKIYIIKFLFVPTEFVAGKV